jgi:protein TonB
MSSADKARFSAVQLPGANLGNSASGNSRLVVTNDGEAPPPRLLKPVSGGVLNGKALSLPVPRYPDIARRSRTAGKVEVQVVVDENGNVISAQALSGPAPLREAAVDAAKRARFSPTKLSGAPVKVAGTIDYNFTLP